MREEGDVMGSEKSSESTNKSTIEDLEREISYLRSLIAAYENLSILREREHKTEQETIEAFKKVTKLAEWERREEQATIKALEETTELATEERHEERAVIEAFEHMAELSAEEKREREKIIEAYESLRDYSSQEHAEDRTVIDAYERLTHLQEQEHKNALETIDAMEKNSALSREEIRSIHERLGSVRKIDHPVQGEIIRILDEDPDNEQHILMKLNLLNLQKNDNNFFSHLFSVLVNLDFNEKEAKAHWEEIIKLNQKDSKALNRKISFRVTLLDYFMNSNKHLKNPKIIEFNFFESTMSDAIFDKLTGLMNRTHMQVAFKSSIRNAERNSTIIGIIMFDVDNFKRFNDFYGHPEGDKLLKSLGEILASVFVSPHSVFRYGGEEFLAVVEVATEDDVFTLAEKVRLLFYNQWKTNIVPVSLSGGYAVLNDEMEDMEELISRADRALYDAKYSGKNIILKYSESRRRNSRLMTNREIAYMLSGESELHHGLTLDVSQGGMAVELEERPLINQPVSIYLDAGDQSEESKLLGRVAWIEEKDVKKYVAGIKLDHGEDSKKAFMRYGDGE